LGIGVAQLTQRRKCHMYGFLTVMSFCRLYRKKRTDIKNFLQITKNHFLTPCQPMRYWAGDRSGQISNADVQMPASEVIHLLLVTMAETWNWRIFLLASRDRRQRPSGIKN